MTSLSPKLLDELLYELSTLASVYHKPSATFLGHGKYGADAIQRAAIQEQRQNAVDNPIAAAVTAQANGTAPPTNNAENLLDIDFDGAAPATSDVPPASGSSGLESPMGNQMPTNSMDDMMGLFGNDSAGPSITDAAPINNDLMNDFAGMSMGGASNQPPPAAQQLAQGKKTNEDLLGMF